MKKSVKTGIDGINFKMVLAGDDIGTECGELELTNAYGTVAATVRVIRDTLHLYINMPRSTRKDNVQPFSVEDIQGFSPDVLMGDLQALLEDNWILSTDIKNCRVKSIESNITLPTQGQCTPSLAMYLLHVCCSDTTNNLYQSASEKNRFLKDTESMSIPLRPNYYSVKVYDKSKEQRKCGNTDVPENLLRVEVVMVDRIINRLFGENKRLMDVLQPACLQKVLDEYRHIFNDEILAKRVIPALQEIEQLLHASLVECGRAVDTIAKYKEAVVDDALWRRALIRWYTEQGQSQEQAAHNASDMLYNHRKKFDLPRDVLLTLLEFEKACGSGKPAISDWL